MAKKNMSANSPSHQTLSMSPSRAHIVGVVTGANLLVPEDDDDDICPVCESECTCQNRAPAPISSIINYSAPATAHSIPSSNAYAVSSSSSQANKLQSLKIKLTVPPTLKSRKHVGAGYPTASLGAQALPSASLSSLSNQLTYTSVPAGASHQRLAPGASDSPVPKRRGRPPKAVVAAREATRAATTAASGAAGTAGTDYAPANGITAGKRPGLVQSHSGKGKQVVKLNGPRKGAAALKVLKGKTTTGKKLSASLAHKRCQSIDSSSDEETLSEKYPTFIPAASTSSYSSSSESSDSELSSLDSEIEEETHVLVRGEQVKAARKVSGGDENQKKRVPQATQWERSRKGSVGLEDGNADDSSNNSSDGGDETDDETDVQVAEEEEDADTEGGGIDDVDSDNEDASSRIGITFGDGGSWSDDEESSLDADLFFANLDGSSDSDSSPQTQDLDAFSDMEFSGSLSADEEDALLLMDIDPSVQIRRNNGEFEFGLDLDSFSFGWDAQLILPSSSPQNHINFGFELQRSDENMDMQAEVADDGETDSEQSATTEEMLLRESDGETTEDELVDANGLPNSRAMMLFRWPTTVSAIDPLSTVGASPSPAPQAPPDASESMRIALASFSAQQKAGTPTPADILAGRISIEGLDDIEMDRAAESPRNGERKRCGGAPVMGEFTPVAVGAQASAVIDGKQGCIPSPFPRRTRKRRLSSTETDCNGSTSSAVVELLSESLLSSQQSSDETFTQVPVPSSELELSSTDAIDLDDVLDSSFLDSDPVTHDENFEEFSQFTLPGSGMHIQNLTRWDRIPMGTFRRTRESAIASTLEGSVSDTGLSVLGGISSLMNSAMLASKASEKKSSSGRKRSKAKGPSTLSVPHDLLPLRDGDRTPTSTGSYQSHKTKKEVRREKAMMKRKMTSKPMPHRHHPQYRTHNHHPNFKSRASGSTQRASSFAGSSSPSFGL